MMYLCDVNSALELRTVCDPGARRFCCGDNYCLPCSDRPAPPKSERDAVIAFWVITAWLIWPAVLAIPFFLYCKTCGTPTGEAKGWVVYRWFSTIWLCPLTFIVWIINKIIEKNKVPFSGTNSSVLGLTLTTGFCTLLTMAIFAATGAHACQRAMSGYIECTYTAAQSVQFGEYLVYVSSTSVWTAGSAYEGVNQFGKRYDITDVQSIIQCSKRVNITDTTSTLVKVADVPYVAGAAGITKAQTCKGMAVTLSVGFALPIGISFSVGAGPAWVSCDPVPVAIDIATETLTWHINASNSIPYGIGTVTIAQLPRVCLSKDGVDDVCIGPSDAGNIYLTCNDAQTDCSLSSSDIDAVGALAWFNVNNLFTKTQVSAICKAGECTQYTDPGTSTCPSYFQAGWQSAEALFYPPEYDKTGGGAFDRKFIDQHSIMNDYTVTQCLRLRPGAKVASLFAYDGSAAHSFAQSDGMPSTFQCADQAWGYNPFCKTGYKTGRVSTQDAIDASAYLASLGLLGLEPKVSCPGPPVGSYGVLYPIANTDSPTLAPGEDSTCGTFTVGNYTCNNCTDVTFTCVEGTIPTVARYTEGLCPYVQEHNSSKPWYIPAGQELCDVYPISQVNGSQYELHSTTGKCYVFSSCMGSVYLPVPGDYKFNPHINGTCVVKSCQWEFNLELEYTGHNASYTEHNQTFTFIPGPALPDPFFDEEDCKADCMVLNIPCHLLHASGCNCAAEFTQAKNTKSMGLWCSILMVAYYALTLVLLVGSIYCAVKACSKVQSK